jgi:hypothetical protein
VISGSSLAQDMSMRINRRKVDGKTRRFVVPEDARPLLLPIAKRVFWWGDPEDWLDDAIRFAAQVMTFGDWDDTVAVWRILGDEVLRQVLRSPPPGVFDLKSWTYWHVRYNLPVPPLPERKLPDV